jgi:L-ascorbate 6-phosphate lactonase
LKRSGTCETSRENEQNKASGPKKRHAMLTHKHLIEDIDRTALKKTEFAVWWIGQHSFVVKTCDMVLYFDPFLSEHPRRMLAPLLYPGEITHADLIFGSHDHTDHIDHGALKLIALAKETTKFVFPDLLCRDLSEKLEIPFNRIIALDDNQSVDYGSVRITGIAASHEFLDQDPSTLRYPYLGYVVETEDLTIYHSGDTCLYEGIFPRLKKWHFDLAFLPINGRDAKRFGRGCMGNMTFQEAADLAGILTPDVTIPGHYGMFANNTIDPMLFSEYMTSKYPRLKITLCKPGEKYTFQAK